MNSTPSTTVIPKKNTRRNLFLWLGLGTFVACIVFIAYYLNGQRYVYTDKAEISAPLIKLTPQVAGVLKHVNARQGDWINAHEIVARVGDSLLQTEVPGIAVVVQQDLGANYNPGQAVVTMIEPKELRVLARVEEDKGLKDLYEGQKAFFTVDAFSGKNYEGTVDTISETKREGDVVFNISDKRESKQFDVKIKYDITKYAELQNGMSAKVWILK